MSFYGSIYYQMAQSFTKILFKNSGWNIAEFLNKKPADSSREAENRADVFSIDSGNRWIQVEPNAEGCKIWHGAPNLDTPTVIQGLEKSEAPPTPSAAIALASGDYFKVPIIQYDDAGHILPATNEAVYYRMPVIDIVSDIDDLEKAFDTLKSTTEQMDSSINKNTGHIIQLQADTKQLNTKIGNFKLVTSKDDESISDIIGNVDAFRIHLEDEDITLTESVLYLKTVIEKLSDTIQGQTQTIGLLSESIMELKERVSALEG